ncbi:MAG: hypothetical protein C0624_07970 [Desulfuromonas sp.]|nr:MAG: hypothetical protein C0624_07970 [Desulfuromonas sp.]
MKKMIRALFWGLVFILILGGIDQLLVQTPFEGPLIGSVRTFYLDFRSRLLGLAPPAEPQSVEQSIEQAVTAPATVQPPQRYVYADASGTLQFADSLDEVPKEFRSDAQPLEE